MFGDKYIGEVSPVITGGGFFTYKSFAHKIHGSFVVIYQYLCYDKKQV